MPATKPTKGSTMANVIEMVSFSELASIRESSTSSNPLYPYVDKTLLIFSAVRSGFGDGECYSGDVQLFDKSAGEPIGDRFSLEFPRRVWKTLDRVLTHSRGRAVLANVVATQKGLTLQ